jgi:hypothetical protein
MIFSLAIQTIVLSLDSQLNIIWYLDDGTLADYSEVVLSDFKKVINVIKEFQNLAPSCDREGLSLLGSPIFDQGFKNTV